MNAAELAHQALHPSTPPYPPLTPRHFTFCAHTMHRFSITYPPVIHNLGTRLQHLIQAIFTDNSQTIHAKTERIHWLFKQEGRLLPRLRTNEL